MFIQTCHLNDEHLCCLGTAQCLLPRASYTQLKRREVLFLCFLFAFPLTPELSIAEVSEFGKYAEISKHPFFMLICKAVVGADSTNTGTRGFGKHSFSLGLQACAVLNLMLQYGLQGPPWDGRGCGVWHGAPSAHPRPPLPTSDVLIATTVNSTWGTRDTKKELHPVLQAGQETCLSHKLPSEAHSYSSSDFDLLWILPAVTSNFILFH